MDSWPKLVRAAQKLDHAAKAQMASIFETDLEEARDLNRALSSQIEALKIALQQAGNSGEELARKDALLAKCKDSISCVCLG